MRARAKISFRSMVRAETIQQTVYTTILKSYEDFNPMFIKEATKVAREFKKSKVTTYIGMLHLLDVAHKLVTGKAWQDTTRSLNINELMMKGLQKAHESHCNHDEGHVTKIDRQSTKVIGHIHLENLANNNIISKTVAYGRKDYDSDSDEDNAEGKMQAAGMVNIIQQMVNKETVYYFLQNVTVDNEPLFEKINQRQWFMFKKVRSKLELQLFLMIYAKNLGTQGLIKNFIEMKILELKKDIFINDVIQGRGLVIPNTF